MEHYTSRYFNHGNRSQYDEQGRDMNEFEAERTRDAAIKDQAEANHFKRCAVEGYVRSANYRGYGPKGYKRSDSRIHEDINDRLTMNPRLDASDIEVAVKESEVTLTGTVESRYAKLEAEDTAAYVLGVTHIQNNLRIKTRPHQDNPTGDATSTTGAPSPATSATGMRVSREE